MTNVEDEAHAAIRQIRGCATDEQYVAVLDAVTELLKKRDAEIARLKADNKDMRDELQAHENDALSRHQ